MTSSTITHPTAGLDKHGIGDRLRRTSTALLSSVALMAATAGSASADPGAPGSTFPEQPGTNVQEGCAAILSNPNNAFFNRAPAAAAITTGLTIDACTAGG